MAATVKIEPSVTQTRASPAKRSVSWGAITPSPRQKGVESAPMLVQVKAEQRAVFDLDKYCCQFCMRTGVTDNPCPDRHAGPILHFCSKLE